MSLVKKLAISFMLTVLGAIVIASFISNYMIDKQFDKYLVSEYNIKVNKVKEVVEDLYNKPNGITEIAASEITRYAVLEQLYIEVRNKENKTVYSSGDSHLYHNQMMGSMMNNMSNTNLGEYVEEKYNLTNGNKGVGTLIIGHFGASEITNNSMEFKHTLNKSFLMSIIVTLILGLAVSIIIAKQLAAPITKVTKISNEMSKGNLEARAHIKSNTVEIMALANSINYLGKTLEKQEMLRRRLTSDMAHEIRTPLTTLKTHLEALIDGIWEPTKERFESFYDEINRLIKLVENLRNIAKLEEANLDLNKTEFNLSKDIENIIESFRLSYEKKGYKIIPDIDREIFVTMDRDKIKQIMYNLLSNAYKFLKEDGEVEVSLNKGEYIDIKVKDNGIGIPEKDLPHIFERFYRTDISRDRKTGGSGIGLTITKALVEAHGGTIEVQSKEGQGSIFTIKLPKS